MREQVILRKDVRKLGDRGQIVSVTGGYARNYLYPQRLAMPATAATKKQVEEMQAAAGRESDQLTGEANTLAEKIEGLTVRAVARAGDTNILFGSITTRDIAALIAEKGFEIDRHQVILGSPIKEVSDNDVQVHIYKDISVSVKVEVRAEGREDEPLVKEKPAEEELVMVEAADADGDDLETGEESSAEGEDSPTVEAEAEPEASPNETKED
jgi:large subunit ribosomal protein L9